MKLLVDTIEGPSYLASALVNGDDSSFDYYGREQCEREIEAFMATVPDGFYVVGAQGEEYMGKYNGLLTDLITYIIHKQGE